jgi:hypothetical protein
VNTCVGAPHLIIGFATNDAAAKAMRKAGANIVVIGEQAICWTLIKADFTLGSMSFLLPGALLGEVTELMV